MEKENNELYDHTYELQINILKNNQYSRRENIEIANISEDIDQQQLENYVLKVFHKLGLNKLTSYDIVAVHRISKKRLNTDRITLVRLINRKYAIFSLKNKNELRNLTDLKKYTFMKISVLRIDIFLIYCIN